MPLAKTTIKIHLTDRELAAVKERADRELNDPGTWIRRTAVSVAVGRVKLIVNTSHPDFACWVKP